LGYIGYSIRIEKANEIIKILDLGDTASNRLLDLITSENKGVIAHYLLTNIFNRPNYHHLEYIESRHFRYNGLELETNDKFEFNAKTSACAETLLVLQIFIDIRLRKTKTFDDGQV
jgi:hypothetical protein